MPLPSPGQGLLAISNDDGRASVWKTTDWTQKRELTLGPEVEGIKSVYEIEFSRDGKSLAAAYWDWDQDRQLWVWDTHTWERTNRLTDIGIFPLGLAFFPDSGRVAVASRQDIKTWDLGTGTTSRLDDFRTNKCSIAITNIVITEDGNELMSGGLLGLVTIIDLENGEQRFTRRFPGILWAVDWSPDHRFIIVSYRGGAEIWNVRAEPPASVFKTNAHGGGDVKDAHFSADGKRAVTLGSDNKIRVWDVADLESEPPGFPPGGPEEVWRHLQQVLNLTLDEDDEVVPLGSEGPSKLAGWDPSLSERFAADQPGDASVRK